MHRLVALALVSLTACSSSYIPRRPGRVAMMMEAGRFVYVRDGQKFDHGLLGGGLEDAVRGNRHAEAAASEYTSRLRGGFLAMLAGAICLPVTAGYMVHRLDEGGEDPGRELTIMLGCSVLMLGGSFYALSAEPYRWDAINIYNDSEPVTPPAYGPGWGVRTPAKKSLSLRD